MKEIIGQLRLDIPELKHVPRGKPGGLKILSCGAGQQSTALALMSCDNVKNPGKFPLVPVYDAVLFCDLGGEPPWVYYQVEFIARACEKAGIPFHVLQDKNLKDDFTKYYGKERVTLIPWWSLSEDGKTGRMRRNCTIDYKIIQMQNFTRWEILGYKKGERTREKDIKAHEMHIGFTSEESQRIFNNPHKLFVNVFPMCEMGLTRADNYAYARETWGLETKGSACQFCPFHSNYFFKYVKEHYPGCYQEILDIDIMLEHGVPNKKNGVPDNKVFISRSRKRIRDLLPEECCDMKCFDYHGEQIWNGF